MPSGFILATVYLPGGEVVDSREFWVARLARVYPLYVCCSCCTPYIYFTRRDAGLVQGCMEDTIDFFHGVFLLQAWYPITRHNQLSQLVCWSLSDEASSIYCSPPLGFLFGK